MQEEEDLDAWTPPKSNDEEQKELSERAALAAVKDWIEAVTGNELKYPDDLRRSLENGAVLCELLNCLKPCIKKINRLPTPMARLDNLNVFFARCRSVFAIRDGYLFDLHDLDDLTQRAFDEKELDFESRKRLLRVAVCVFWVAKSSEAFFDGPHLNYAAFASIVNDQGRNLASRHVKTFRKLAVATALSCPPSNGRAEEAKAPVRRSVPRLPAKDPDYLVKQAVEQMKQLADDKMLRKSVHSEEDDQETGLWQRSLSDWREKRRRQSATFNTNALELKEREERKLHSQLNDSHESADLSSWLGVASSVSVDESEAADVFSASSDGEVAPARRRGLGQEVHPARVGLAAMAPVPVDIDGGDCAPGRPEADAAPSGGVADPGSPHLEPPVACSEPATPEANGAHPASGEESVLSSGIDEGRSSTTATDSSVDINDNVQRREMEKEKEEPPAAEPKRLSKKYPAPQPPSSVSTSSSLSAHRKGRAPPPPPPPVARLASEEEKKDPLTPPRQRRRSNPRVRLSQEGDGNGDDVNGRLSLEGSEGSSGIAADAGKERPKSRQPPASVDLRPSPSSSPVRRPDKNVPWHCCFRRTKK